MAMLAVLSWPDLEVVHVVSAMVKLTAPYIPGFLAFREAPHLLALLDALKAERPELIPQVKKLKKKIKKRGGGKVLFALSHLILELTDWVTRNYRTETRRVSSWNLDGEGVGGEGAWLP